VCSARISDRHEGCPPEWDIVIVNFMCQLGHRVPTHLVKHSGYVC
jgi:hypothetical protein